MTEAGLSPNELYYLGRVTELAGTIWMTILGVAFVIVSITSTRVATDLLIWASIGAIAFPLGELQQWAAKRKLEEVGQTVPEGWQRTRGTVAVLDRHVGEALRTPIVEWFRGDRRDQGEEVCDS